MFQILQGEIMLSVSQLKALATDLESDRVERTISVADTEKFREAICAFANDMPGNALPGFLLIGVQDDGNVAGVQVTDQLLRRLADRRDDGKIEPMPVMSVYKVDVTDKIAVAVVEVQPSDSPPVRANGRIWIRVGPRRAIASADEERRLVERRVSKARTWDGRSCPGAGISDLAVAQFQTLYLPNVIAADVLAQNQRTVEDRLASLRLYDPAAAHPTNGGVVLFGLDPLGFVPGAYVQLVRYDGKDLAAPVIDSKRITGSLATQLQELDLLLPLHIRVSRKSSGGLRQSDQPDYPLRALRELTLNALMHRSYEATNSPVRINWFIDRVEIQNPGGLFGQVTPQNFGRVPDYRNPIISEAMNGLGYVEKWGTGVARARDALASNGNSEPEFSFEATYFQVTLRALT